MTADERPEKKFPVVEIFGPTIEGEGKIAGMQTFFIRFGLCDYKCTRCDSMHAVNPRLVKAGAAYLTATEIAANLNAMATINAAPHVKNVVFSGGNPAIHDLFALTNILVSEGWSIYVETQGTKTQNWMRFVKHITVSPKSPGMGEKFEPEVFRNFMMYFTDNVPVTVKIVVFSAQDLEFAAGVASILQDLKWFNLEENFYLSLGNPFPPVFGIDDETGQVGQAEDQKINLVSELLNHYNILSEEIMKDPRLSFARFLPQLHVLIWGNETGR
jgi:7-carboxy-7-deazaguanine synthase